LLLNVQLSQFLQSYLTSGIFIGGCVYNDICTLFQQLFPQTFNPAACPSEFAEYGIDCTCPFNIRSGPVDVVNALLNLPDFNDPNAALGGISTFFGKGDYDVTIKAEDPLGKLACLRIKYSIKPLV
jgi:hypothetical protein